MLREKTRHTTGGITREELTNMLEKYNIGKKPLAKLLGWGETTILLYLREDEEELPNNEYTRRLKNLYVNTSGFIALLNNSQGRISDVARRRSMEAVRNLFPNTKIFAAAEYVSELNEISCLGMEGEAMSLLRLETILFWAQVISLCLYDKAIFEEDFMPSRSGMPYRAVEERMQQTGCIVPEGLYDDPGVPASILSDEEKEILKYTLEMFDWYGTGAINALMEAERFRLCGPKGARKRRIASKEMLKRCYGDVFNQAKVRKLKDVELYMQKRINYIRKLNIE